MGSRSDQHAQLVARRLELLTFEAELDELESGEPEADEPEAHGPRPVGTELERFDPDEPFDAWLVEPVPAGLPTIPRPGRHASRRQVSWLPESLQGRITLGPAQVAVVAVALAVGLVITAWWVLRSQPEPLDPAPINAPLISPAGLPGATPAEGPTELVVDVAGKVRRPGIVVLEPGSRVVDALKAAGGAGPRVDLSSLNLARLVVDGEQILVGLSPAPGVAASAAASPGAPAPGALVNINLAGQPELEGLPGVGPVTAAAIIAFREESGSFTSVDQLLDVSGIGEATLAEIAPHVTV